MRQRSTGTKVDCCRPARHGPLVAGRHVDLGGNDLLALPPPIDDETVNRTLEYLPAVIADMVQFQRATGCRPGEVCNIRPCDIDRTHDVWLYQPVTNKTEHEETDRRVIAIGPKAQNILMPYLQRPAKQHCFSPYESEQKRREKRTAQRTTPASCGNRTGTNRKKNPKRQASQHYKVSAYCKAIHRAIE